MSDSEDMSDRERREYAEAMAGPPWGFMEGDTFTAVPKGPLLRAGLRPPCTVELPQGGSRKIIEMPLSGEIA